MFNRIEEDRMSWPGTSLIYMRYDKFTIFIQLLYNFNNFFEN
jgi:hypothetical protein